MHAMNRFAKTFQRIRGELGLSQGQVAIALTGQGIHITRATVTNWENGTALPRMGLLRALFYALPISIRQYDELRDMVTEEDYGRAKERHRRSKAGAAT